MHASATASEPDRVLEVQHFVIDDVLHREPRDSRVIEDAAHHDGVVSGIVVPQAVARVLAAPRHLRTGQQSVEKLQVQNVEDGLEIIGVTLRRIHPLPAAHLPNQVRLARHMLTGHVSAVSRGVLAVNRLAVHLGEKNMRDRPQDVIGCPLEQVGDAHQQLALAQPDGVIDVGEAEKFDPELRNRGPRPELAVSFPEEF